MPYGWEEKAAEAPEPKDILLPANLQGLSNSSLIPWTRMITLVI